MHNFTRALKVAINYWPSLLLAMICSLGVALIWGGNIGAIYPVMEVTLAGKSLQAWNTERLTESQQRTADIEKELQTLANRELNEKENHRQNELQTKLQSEQAIQIAAARMQPWLNSLFPVDPFNTVLAVVGLLFVTTLIKSALLVANEWLVARVSHDITRDIRRQIFNRALILDKASFQAHGTSAFAAQIIYTADQLARGLANALGGLVREPLKIIACLVGAGYICWRLLLLSMIVAPLAGFFIYWIGRKLRSVSTSILSQSTGLHEVMLESLGNLQTVQAYCMENEERQRFTRTTDDMRYYSMKVVFYTTLAKPVIEVFGLGMIAVTMLGGAYLILYRQTSILGIPICDAPLTAPQMLIFFGLLVGASDPLRKMGAVMQFINAGIIAADNLYPLLDMPSKIVDPENPKSIAKPHRLLSLRDIQFGYQADRPILQDVSLDIPFGSTVCIVGANGTGKSTMMQLVCRFYDPQAGSVQIDQTDLRDVAIEDLRSRIALVTQSTELFNRSVIDNIRYGNLSATEEEIREAAVLAHADEFITKQLRNGYQTQVGTGGQFLSGGQRQRISLARALLRKPEILILDEATSQIDMNSELLIRDSLAQLKGKQTILIITHREALLDLADVIYEVRNGQLVEVSAFRSAAA
jgi:ATP-binding cassette subfamily B protein/subfamily B ATP-binding cassette protein MsbA